MSPQGLPFSPAKSMDNYKDNYRNPYVPPVTPAQLKAVGKDPDCLYWSADFHCWRLTGDWIRPYATTGRQLAELKLTIHPDA